MSEVWRRARSGGGDAGDRPAAGGLRAALVALLLTLVLAVVLGFCGRGDAYAVASCLEDAKLRQVDNRRVGAAEDIEALGSAPEEADDFVSAVDSAGRDVYVLVYDSVSDAEDAQAEVAPGLESGARGNKLLVFSPTIGNQDRLAVEKCFLEDDVNAAR